jgi:hypothetical protein
MLGRKRRIQWKLIEQTILSNKEKLSNSEMWKNVLYLPIEKGSLYKANREDLEAIGWYVVETINGLYYIVPTALWILQ